MTINLSQIQFLRWFDHAARAGRARLVRGCRLYLRALLDRFRVRFRVRHRGRPGSWRRRRLFVVGNYSRSLGRRRWNDVLCIPTQSFTVSCCDDVAARLIVHLRHRCWFPLVFAICLDANCLLGREGRRITNTMRLVVVLCVCFLVPLVLLSNERSVGPAWFQVVPKHGDGRPQFATV